MKPPTPPRPLAALLLTALAAAVSSHAEPLPGEAEVRVRVTVDAQALTDRLDKHDAELAELRQAVAGLAQGSASDPPDKPDPVVTPPDPPLTGDGSGGGGGFLTFPKAPDARTVYVSADGLDRNHGRTPDAPMRTAAAAYQRLRDGRPDRLLFRAGDTFTGNLGKLTKSGRSAEEPMVIGVYPHPDNPDAGRPVMLVQEDSWAAKEFRATADHVVFDGLHLVAQPRDPSSPGWTPERLNEKTWRIGGIVFLGGGENVTIHDCKLEYFHFALVLQSNPDNGRLRNVTIHRSIVRNSYGHWNPAIAHHSSGLYAAYLDGLTVTECLFDRNGWNPDVRGAKATKFNHNLYIQSDGTGNNLIRGNVIARGSAHGLQLRPGGVIDDNLFLDNPLAFFVGIAPSRVTDNVVLGSRDINDDPGEERGFGFDIQPLPECLVENNIVSQKRQDAGGGTAPWAHAIKLDGSDGVLRTMRQRYPGSTWSVIFRGNKVHDWPREHGPTVWVERRGVELDVTGMDTTAIDAPDWVDPGRDVESYMQSLGRPASVAAYLDRLAERPRGVWYDDLSAAAVNDYVRAGFERR